MTTRTVESIDVRGYAATRNQLDKRLRRIEGQVRGLQRMLADDRACPEILQQIAAVKAALDKVALGVAEGHVHHCIEAGGSDPGLREDMTQELMLALARLV